MENYFDNFRPGDRFYDSYNDRYITLDGVSNESRIVTGYVEEYNMDIEDYVLTGRYVFTMREINKFERKED